MTGLDAIRSALVGRQLWSVGKRNFKKARITDVRLEVYLVLTLECQDKIGRKCNRQCQCDINDDLKFSYTEK